MKSKIYFFVFCLFATATIKGNSGFSKNVGQVHTPNQQAIPAIQYFGSSGDLGFYFTETGINYQFYKASYAERKIEAENYKGRHLPSVSSFTIARVEYELQGLQGNLKWQASDEVARDLYYTLSKTKDAAVAGNYANLKAFEVYEGIDWHCYYSKENFKYDFIVAAGSDYRQIKFEIKGAQKISVDKAGNLIIETALGQITEQRPVVLQHGKALKAAWQVIGNTVSFEISEYDKNASMVIDPMVRYWGTYLGGTGDEWAYYATTDTNGNAYFSGETTSATNIATTGAYLQTYQGAGGNWGDAFVIKYDAQGNKVWCTYYGGSGDDWAGACATDAAGNIYFVGYTTCSVSAQITTSGAYQQNYASTVAQGDLFLVKFNSQGQRIWATYFGGESTEYGAAMCLDNANNIYISGRTFSGIGMATAGAYQTSLSGTEDGFIAKFNNAGNRIWSTYYGGPSPGYESVNVLSVDGFGNLFFGGFTHNTSGIATLGSFQTNHAPPSQTNDDGFFGKMNTNGQLQWASYIGSTGSEFLNDMHCDNVGGVYFCGQTTSPTSTLFASTGAFQTSFAGYKDGFVARFDGAGNRMWGSYFGAGGDDYFTGVTLDLSGNPILSGTTGSVVGNSLATNCVYQQQLGGGMEDAFLVKFNPTGQRQWCTFYGGNQNDEGGHLAIDNTGNLYLVGMTRSTNTISIASTNAVQSNFGGGNFDAFVAKFDGCVPGKFVNDIPLADLQVCPGNRAVLNSSLNCIIDWYKDSLTTQQLASTNSFTSGVLLGDTTFFAETFSCGAYSVRAAIHVSMAAVPQISVSATPSAVCAGQWIYLMAQGAQTYSWSTGSTVAAAWVNPNSTSVYTIIATGANSCSVASLYQLNVANCTDLVEEGKEDIQLFPNPVTVNLTIESGEVPFTEILLVDVYGRTVLINSNKLQRTTVDCSALSNGIYVLKCMNGNQQVYSRRVVKE